MKVFLTGSTGFLGNAIMHYLPDYEYFCYKRGDDVTQKLKEFKPDIIIHSAGEIYKNEKMFNSNVLLTLNILDYVRDNHVVKTIYFGSSSEYGKVQKEMKETDVCNPETLYAATKTCGTVLAQAYARTYDKDICVVRPFSIYGPFEPEHRLVPTLYRKISNDEEVSLINGYHDFFYIEDFVNLIEIVIKSDKEKTKGDILNAGSGFSYSNLEIAYIFSKVLDKHLKCVLLDKTKECDSTFWKADTSHIIQKYNFRSKFSLEKGLTSYKIYQHEHFTKCTGI